MTKNLAKVDMAPLFFTSLRTFYFGMKTHNLNRYHAHFLANFFAVCNCASAMLHLGGTVYYKQYLQVHYKDNKLTMSLSSTSVQGTVILSSRYWQCSFISNQKQKIIVLDLSDHSAPIINACTTIRDVFTII